MSQVKTSTKVFEKIFGILLIFGGLIGLTLLFDDPVNEKSNVKIVEQATLKDNKNKLSLIWRKDFEKMRFNETDPFKKVNSIKVFMLDKKLHHLMAGLKPPISTGVDKPLQLEVSFMTHKSEIQEKNMLVIQYNFIDTASENMVQEFSRQIELNETFFAKKKPSQKTN